MSNSPPSPPSPPVGRGAQDHSKRQKFESEVRCIPEAGDRPGLTLCLLAFQLHRPAHGSLQAQLGRACTDINTTMPLLEHPLGDIDVETINVARVARLRADERGLWRTKAMSLGKVAQMAQTYTQLTGEQRARISVQVEGALARINAAPKPLHWTIRSRAGDRVKWYKDVDEVK